MKCRTKPDIDGKILFSNYRKTGKVRRWELVNAADGWKCNVVCVDREQNSVMVRTWFTNGRELQVSEDDNSLILPGTNTVFVLPSNDDEGD